MTTRGTLTAEAEAFITDLDWDARWADWASTPVTLPTDYLPTFHARIVALAEDLGFASSFDPSQYGTEAAHEAWDWLNSLTPDALMFVSGDHPQVGGMVLLAQDPNRIDGGE